MTREEAKLLLGENSSDEQISNLLNKFHTKNSDDDNEINNLKSKVKSFEKKDSEYQEMKKKIDKIEREKLTKEEAIALKEKEIDEKFKKASMLLNTVKAKNILITAGIDETLIDEEMLDGIVSGDETVTVNRANKLANLHKITVENVTKKTKEDLANINVKPNMSNVLKNGIDDNNEMTKEIFNKLSIPEKTKLFNEDNDLWKKLSGK